MEIKKKDNDSEIRANFAKEKKKLEIINFCRPNCQVCSSGHLEYITEARRNGAKLVELSADLKNKFNIDLSKDVLWRHFKNYNKRIQLATAEKLLTDFNNTVEDVARHQKSTLFLINKSFEHIMSHLDNGTIILGVDDFEKLVKLYYQVLRNPDTSNDTDKDIVGIFQRASSKYGFPLEQGILFKSKSNIKE